MEQRIRSWKMKEMWFQTPTLHKYMVKIKGIKGPTIHNLNLCIWDFLGHLAIKLKWYNVEDSL